MDWEMFAIVGWIGALIINVIFTIDTIKERREYIKKREELWEKEYLLEQREEEFGYNPSERTVGDAGPYDTGEPLESRSSVGPWRDKGICEKCIYNKMDCHECTVPFGIGFYDKFEGSGWSEKVIDDNQACRCDCAEATGFCVYYKENEKDVVFCKDCKYGVKMDEPDDWGKEWDCSKDLIGMAWNEEKECCPCGERKEEGGNEE